IHSVLFAGWVGSIIPARANLAHAIGNLGDLELGRNLFTDAAQLAMFFERLHPVAQIVVSQQSAPFNGLHSHGTAAGRRAISASPAIWEPTYSSRGLFGGPYRLEDWHESMAGMRFAPAGGINRY